MHTPSVSALMLICALLAACSPADDSAKTKMANAEPALAAAAEKIPASTVSELAKVPSGAYTIDKNHAYISFTYLHKGLSNPIVGFRDFDVELNLDTEKPQNSTFKVMIDPASIDSRVAEFDDHLKGEKMFDIAKFPDITFTSSQIRMTGANTMEVTGDLTMKGVTKPVTLATRINKATIDTRSNLAVVGVSASTTVKRSEWNLGYAVPFVGDEVTITIELEMPQVAPAG